MTWENLFLGVINNPLNKLGQGEEEKRGCYSSYGYQVLAITGNWLEKEEVKIPISLRSKIE